MDKKPKKDSLRVRNIEPKCGANYKGTAVKGTKTDRPTPTKKGCK